MEEDRQAEATERLADAIERLVVLLEELGPKITEGLERIPSIPKLPFIGGGRRG